MQIQEFSRSLDKAGDNCNWPTIIHLPLIYYSMHRKIAYFFTLYLLLSLSWGLEAQIAYLDVPDQTLTVGQSATFDLTSDGDNEINISVNMSGSTFITFTRPALNSGVSQTATLQLSGPNIRKLAAGDVIGPSSGTYTAGSTFFVPLVFRRFFLGPHHHLMICMWAFGLYETRGARIMPGFG